MGLFLESICVISKGVINLKIALFGKMRSGKDTVGKFLVDQFNFQRLAFGDEIGTVIETYFPEAFKDGKPRHHYQFIGQRFRELDQDVWVKKVLQKVIYEESMGEILNYGPLNFVITDGRQLNEAEKMREAGFLIVKVECDEDLRIERIKASGDNFNPEQLQHETELQVDMIQPDYVIKNDGTLEALHIQVMKLVETLVGGVNECE